MYSGSVETMCLAWFLATAPPLLLILANIHILHIALLRCNFHKLEVDEHEQVLYGLTTTIGLISYYKNIRMYRIFMYSSIPYYMHFI